MAVLQAKARFIRIAPRKVILVSKLVKGKKIDEALNILTLKSKKASKVLLKLLKSAAANAEAREEIDIDSLHVKTIRVDQGPTLKRFRPRAMGRANRIRKRSSHITIVLEETF